MREEEFDKIITSVSKHVAIDKEKVKNGEPHKFDEIGWFTLDNLPQPPHSQLAHEIELFGNRLKA